MSSRTMAGPVTFETVPAPSVGRAIASVKKKPGAGGAPGLMVIGGLGGRAAPIDDAGTGRRSALAALARWGAPLELDI